jgi:cobyrinic acid a,c-diamide synthase
MVLGEALTDADGRRHEMTGLLGLETSFAKRKLHLGYRRARLQRDCSLGSEGTEVFGHEFHYATTLSAYGDALFAARDSYGVDLGQTGLRRGSVAGSFMHLIDRAED